LGRFNREREDKIIIPKVSVKECENILLSGKPQETIIQWLRFLLKSELNFDTYSRFIFPDAFFKPFAECHYHMGKFLFSDESGAEAQPRSFGKSTETGIGYVTHRIAYRLKNYILYLSENHDKSMMFIDPIKYELKNNKLFNFIYGPFKIGRTKDKDSGKDRQDVFDVNRIRVQALSFEKDPRGVKHGNFRPDLMIFDDIENRQRVINPRLRHDDWLKITKDLIPALDPETGIWKWIGTILHQDSGLKKMIKKTDGRIIKAENPDGSSTFPTMWPKERLMKRKEEIGALAYQQEYMNEPVADELSIIKREYLNPLCDETLSYGDKLDFKTKILGWDQASGDSVKSDNSVFLTLGDGTGKYEGKYVLNSIIWDKTMTALQQLNHITQVILPGKNYHYVAAEENHIRNFSRDIIQSIKFPFKMFWMGSSDPSAKKKSETEFKEKRHTVGKANFIERLSIRTGQGNISKGKYVFPYKTSKDKEITNRLFDEMVSWSRQDGKIIESGVHPDAPISLGLASELLDMLAGREILFGTLDLGETKYEEDTVETRVGVRYEMCAKCGEYFRTRKEFKSEKDIKCRECGKSE